MSLELIKIEEKQILLVQRLLSESENDIPAYFEALKPMKTTTSQRTSKQAAGHTFLMLVDSFEAGVKEVVVQSLTTSSRPNFSG